MYKHKRYQKVTSALGAACGEEGGGRRASCTLTAPSPKWLLSGGYPWDRVWPSGFPEGIHCIRTQCGPHLQSLPQRPGERLVSLAFLS